jgi:hypothetical protein
MTGVEHVNAGFEFLAVTAGMDGIVDVVMRKMDSFAIALLIRFLASRKVSGRMKLSEAETEGGNDSHSFLSRQKFTCQEYPKVNRKGAGVGISRARVNPNSFARRKFNTNGSLLFASGRICQNGFPTFNTVRIAGAKSFDIALASFETGPPDTAAPSGTSSENTFGIQGRMYNPTTYASRP